MFGSTDHDHVFTGVIRVTTWCDGSSIGQRVPPNEPYMVIGFVLPEGNVSLSTAFRRVMRMTLFIFTQQKILGGFVMLPNMISLHGSLSCALEWVVWE